MARPIPTSREVPFNPEELFFSRTDEKGVILSGNDIFVRVSGYARSQLLGSPHNIVRHPDMPKCVFKLLWTTIQDKRPICAYVKNLAADGSFYWVVATVFPLPDGQGYLSVRLKPTGPTFEKVKQLYPKVLEKEKKEGVDPALAFLVENLKSLGFETYEKFMSHALVEEIQSRAKLTGAAPWSDAGGDNGATRSLRQIGRRCSDNAGLTSLVFSKLADFASVNSDLSEKSAFILKSFKNLDLLAINMSTAAKRLGSEGATLVAVANGITKAAGEFKADLNTFNGSARQVGVSIEKANFQIAASRLQVDMIEFYVRETLAKWAASQVDAAELEDMKTNARFLLGLSEATTRSLLSEMTELRGLLAIIGSNSDQLRATINGVEIIRKTGVIEAAQVSNEGGEFQTYFLTMNELVAETSRKMASFGDAVRRSIESIDTIVPTLGRVVGLVAELSAENEKLTI